MKKILIYIFLFCWFSQGFTGELSSQQITKKKLGRTRLSNQYKILPPYDWTKIKLTKTLEEHSKEKVWSLAISPDGETIVSGSSDNTIKIWDLESGRLLKTLEGHRDNVTSLAISPDGETIVSGSSDNTINIWSLEKIGDRVEWISEIGNSKF